MSMLFKEILDQGKKAGLVHRSLFAGKDVA